jgi:prepilin-type processing-associated H-X9-DG protein
VKSADLFRCKSSRLLVIESGQPYPLARTISMNGWMGYNSTPWKKQPFTCFHKTTDLTGLTPGAALVFVDERDDSVDEGYFCVDMVNNSFDNVPSDFHAGSGAITFADGHAELHRWQSAELQIPQQSGLNATDTKGTPAAPDNTDMLWLRAHATYAAP